jgi:hypothetical protein
MKTKHSVDFTFFAHKQQDVELLYRMYVDCVRVQKTKGNHKIPDTFVLVSAFASVHSELEVAFGYVGFVSDINHVTRKVQYEMPEHYWLTWRDPDYIIDLLPLDGEFGISIPQAVIQKKKLKRFFPSKNLYPKNWGVKERVTFDSDVSDLVVVLEGLQKMVPL